MQTEGVEEVTVTLTVTREKAERLCHGGPLDAAERQLVRAALATRSTPSVSLEEPCEKCGDAKEVLKWAVAPLDGDAPVNERWEPCPDCKPPSEGEEGEEKWDATNCVRLCDRCEKEYGIGAGADKGDRACAGCGSESAPHIYPARDSLLTKEQAEKVLDLWESETVKVRDGAPGDFDADERRRAAGGVEAIQRVRNSLLAAFGEESADA